MSSILVWLLAGLLGLGGLANQTEAQVTQVEPGTLGDVVSQRPLLPACGLLDLNGPSNGMVGGWRCLREGFRGDGAELLTVQVLGGPADRTRHQILRALPDGSLEIWTQLTHVEGFDLVGEWHHRTCAPSEDLRRRPCAP